MRYVLLFFALLASCADPQPAPPSSPSRSAVSGTGAEADTTARGILAATIAHHGGERYRDAVVEFDFRDRHFTLTLNGSQYRYERTYTNEAGQSVREWFDGAETIRLVDGDPVQLTADEDLSLTGTLNSVAYFALLPHSLLGPAVKHRYLTETSIGGEPYHEIEVTFQQEGGGRDWQDRFVYWIHARRRTMDYLAYRFYVDGGGTRFRVATNPRVINGLRLQDYHNLTAPEPVDIADYETLYEAGQVESFSDILLEDVRVR